MDPWGRSGFTDKITSWLIEDGLLHPMMNTTQLEWIIPGNEDESNPPAIYVISFAHFHEWGFGMPASNFFRGLLHYYGIELQNLNPNSILQIMVFGTLCEGYLGIKPNFALWKYYFYTTIFYKTMKKGETVLVRIDSCAIQLRQSRVDRYITMKGLSSNKGWHQRWFYLRSDADAPLPLYTGRFFEETPAR
jgi:hypothetical protein